MFQPKISKNRISRRAGSFTESVIREMSREAAKYSAVNLGQGFPDWAAPEDIKRKAMEAIASDHNQYAVTWGVKEFRDSIAKKTMWFLGMDIDPDAEITVTCGSTEGMIAAMMATVDPGEEVIVFEPFYENYAPGAILANELLDALPIHRVDGGRDGALLERYVALASVAAGDNAHGGGPSQLATNATDTTFTTVLGSPSSLALAERLAAEQVTLEPGQPAEICLAIDDWVRSAVAPLERGVLLLIDYGYPAAELYRPARGSTLRAYHRHRVHADPLVAIGRQDLTAHVDLTAVERAAVAAGLEPLGRTTQAGFLDALGAGELLVALQTDPATTLESYFEARSALVRMLDPRATGGFAVLALGRGMGPEAPAGFRPPDAE